MIIHKFPNRSKARSKLYKFNAMRRMLRSSHDQRRRASLKSDEENLINVTDRKYSDSHLLCSSSGNNQRRKSLPANAFYSGHNNHPNTSTYAARKKLRRFMTINDDAYEMKYLIAASVICGTVLLIIIFSLYQLLID